MTSDGTPLGSFGLVNGQGSVTTASLTTGAHTIVASYVGDGTFDSSTGTIAETVGQASTATTIAPSVNPSTLGQAVTFTATVTATPPGSGVPTGTVTFKADAGQFGRRQPSSEGRRRRSRSPRSDPAPTRSPVPDGGDTNYLSSTGSVVQVVTCQVNITSQFNGTLTVTQSTCVSGTTVNGNVIVQPGGSLSFSGSTLNGSISSNGATTVRLCGNTLPNVTVANSTGFVLIGDGGDDGAAGCAGNKIFGSITLTNNHAGAEIGGNTQFGNITLNGTTGVGPSNEDAAPEVEANNVQGTLGCTGNSPAPTKRGQAQHGGRSAIRAVRQPGLLDSSAGQLGSAPPRRRALHCRGPRTPARGRGCLVGCPVRWAARRLW